MAVELVRITDPDSTMVQRMTYSYATHKLTVTFKNGSVYIYDDVPNDVYAQVRASSSTGKAFNAYIKNNYHFAKAATAT